jgi:hypothetical protein
MGFSKNFGKDRIIPNSKFQKMVPEFQGSKVPEMI